MNFNFVNRIKGDLILQVSEHLTVKDLIIKYCSKIGESPDKYWKTIFFVYQGKNIAQNSSQKIGNLFMPKDEIYIIWRR